MGLSIRAFDNGLIGEAARVANAVFMLVGRGMRNHTSILDSANQQNKRKYRSTLSSDSIIGSPLIVCVLHKVEENTWEISLKHIGRDALSKGRDLSFDDWWSEKVFLTNDCELTREQIVRILRDRNGGAHFDAHVSDDLVAAAIQGRVGAFEFKHSETDESETVQGALEHCMRQIAEELWFSMGKADT